MAFYQSTDQVYAVLGQLFDRMQKESNHLDQFAKSHLVIRINLADPLAEILVDGRQPQIFYGARPGRADLELHMPADLSTRFGWASVVCGSPSLAARSRPRAMSSRPWRGISFGRPSISIPKFYKRRGCADPLTPPTAQVIMRVAHATHLRPYTHPEFTRKSSLTAEGAENSPRERRSLLCDLCVLCGRKTFFATEPSISVRNRNNESVYGWRRILALSDEVKSRVDIVELVSRYAPLQRAGRTYKACCPFHDERTPSFVVFPDTGTWHCFGACATGGDAFSFLMKKENIDFKEALQVLLKRPG